MKKVSSRKHDRFGRVLDSDPVYLIAALALMALLVSFYAVLLVNMNAIDTKTEDLKEHPYAVTVAAGRAETLLMQVRTLDNRLAFARTPETVASVKRSSPPSTKTCAQRSGWLNSAITAIPRK